MLSQSNASTRVRASWLAVLVLGTAVMQAQTNTATVLGTVVDATGASVPEATIQVRNSGTGQSRNVNTDPQGRYTVADLVIGTYEVQASKNGFQTILRQNVVLTIGSQRVEDFSLAVGQSQQTVTVQAEVSQVETTTSTVANLVEQKQMRELPLNGRNFQQLILLAPGVNVAQTATGSFYGKGDTYSVGGARPEGQAYLLDGQDTTNFFNHGTGAGSLGTSLGLDAIAEFQTLTSTYSAQFGGNGAVVNAVSRGGTNDLHGTLFEFLRNSRLDARDFFEGAKPAPFKRNQFGGALGGAIKKDKLFFFGNYEGLQQVLTRTRIATVPDANAHRGIVPVAGVPTNVGFASPLIQRIMDLYPLPTTQNFTNGVPNGTGTVAQLGKETGKEHYVMGRLDYIFNEKDSLFGRYTIDDAAFTNPFPNFPAGAVNGWVAKEPTRNQYIALEEKHLFSPAVIGVFRLGFARTSARGETQTSNPALQFYPHYGGQDGNIAITGLSTLGPTALMPYMLIQNKFMESGDIYITKGAHNIKFGATVTRLQTHEDQPFSAAGSFTFPSIQAFLQGNPTRYGGAIPLPQGGDAYRSFREILIYPYINDDWKITRRLTLNIGVRFDFDTNPKSAINNLQVITNPPFNSIGGPISTGFTQVPNVWKTNPARGNWGPRIGFAYELTKDHKTSLRGGFGDFHNVIAPRTWTSGYVTGPPFFSVIYVPNPALPVIPFPNPFVGSVSTPIVSNGQTVDYNLTKSPALYQWNLNLQRELPLGTVLTMGYVGSHGSHLLTQSDQNPAIPLVGADGITRYGRNNVINRRWSTNFGTINALQPNGNSNYNALQLNAVRRFSNNVSAQVAYTWSKAIDDGSGSSGLETGGGARSNAYNFAADRGPSTFDIRHALRMNSVVALPFKGNRVVEGWQISGVMSATSAPPLLLATGFDRVLQGASGIVNQRPNLKPGFTAESIRQAGNRLQWYNPAAFEIQPEGTPGNLGRNTIRGVGLFNLDASVTKNTKIRERVDLQFKAEFFNILNHTNFGVPNLNLFTAGALSTNGTGLIANPNPSAGLITNTNPGTTSRQIQFGLKLNF